MSRLLVIVEAVGLAGALLSAIGIVTYLVTAKSYWALLAIFPLIVLSAAIAKITEFAWKMAVEDSKRNSEVSDDPK